MEVAPNSGIHGDKERYTTAIAILTIYLDYPLRKRILSLTLSAGTYSYVFVILTRKYKRVVGGTLRTCVNEHRDDD